MVRSFEQVEADALDLPDDDRARLAHRLLASLEEHAYDDPAGVERAWDDEIRRRLASLDAGSVETIPASQVFREARKLLE